jgi:hypothetical protein
MIYAVLMFAVGEFIVVGYFIWQVLIDIGPKVRGVGTYLRDIVGIEALNIRRNLQDIVQLMETSPQFALSEEVVKSLKARVSAKTSKGIDDQPVEAYRNGLNDGATELAKYILEEIGAK